MRCRGTAKLSYQENLLWYAIVKIVMPDIAHDTLYNEAHEMLSLSDIPGTNVHHDEAMEMGSIRHWNMLGVGVPGSTEAIPSSAMLVGNAHDTVERHLDLSRKRSTRNAELKFASNQVNQYG